ncbi:MAG: carboxypeptidase regulatory-like domain-containing protein, partial [Terriglobia bacterium]
MACNTEIRRASCIRTLATGLLLVGVLGVWGALAQLPTATILGTISDGTGAVVPGAMLTARNVETGQTRTTTSGGDGAYRFTALPVGAYEVRVESSGFQTQIRSGLTLAVAQEAVIHFTLQVGAVEQTVSVTADAPLIETTSGSLGGLVNEQKISELPLNGRNYIDLTLTQTGVNLHARHGDTAGATGTWFSSSGAPVRSNSFLLDGASMVTTWGTSSASIGNTTLGIDGIREFRVVTNAFSAEYGMSMGSQTVIVSKNGTNQFHG